MRTEWVKAQQRGEWRGGGSYRGPPGSGLVRLSVQAFIARADISPRVNTAAGSMRKQPRKDGGERE